MNAVWALDFMRDTLYSGRVFRTLNVIDEANQGALGIDVAVGIPAARVTTLLTQMIDLHGRPAAIRSDNGPELTSHRDARFIAYCCNRRAGFSLIARHLDNRSTGYQELAKMCPFYRTTRVPAVKRRRVPRDNGGAPPPVDAP